MSARVVVITPSIKPGGGPPGYVYNMMKGFERFNRVSSNHRIEFIGRHSSERNKATGESAELKKINPRAIVALILDKLGLKPFLSPRIRAAKRSIRQSEVAVFQGFQEAYLLDYARRHGVATVYMPHSPSVSADEYKMLCELNDTQFNEKRYSKILETERRLFSGANAVIFPSQGASLQYLDTFAAELNAKKAILYVKSGISLNTDTPSSPRHASPPKIFFVGRYVAHKGYDLFCQAASQLRESGLEAEFFTLGDGPMKSPSSHVTNLGWQNDVIATLEKADIVVVPNRLAYYDLLPLECAALGKPLVMTMVGGNVDQLRDLPDCIPCPEASVPHLASAIREAVDRFHHDPFWGGKNRVAFDRHFTAEALAQRWDEALCIIRAGTNPL